MIQARVFKRKRTQSAYVTSEGEVVALFHGKTQVEKLKNAISYIRKIGLDPKKLPVLFWQILQLHIGRKSWADETIQYIIQYAKEHNV